jgi:acetylornithine aminotransferase
VDFVKGENSTLYSSDNKDYIDFTSGIGVCSIGHGNKKLAQAICEQSQNILHISNLYAIKPQALLAQEIVKQSGFDMACFFANSGAEANEGAIKIARKYGQTKFDNKKYKVITLKNSFHGRTITTVKATGQEKMHTPNFSPYPKGFSYNQNIEDIYNNIDDETIAVMIELIQGEGGVTPFEKEQIQSLAKFLKEKEILLIVDEVQTGVYRTGEFLACNYYEIEPDIITLAKGLGGGLPIGVVMTKHKDILSVGDHGSTFGGGYLVTTGAKVVLQELLELKQNNTLANTISYFDKKLEELKNKFEFFNKSVGIGLMRGLRVKNDEILSSIIQKAFDEGVLVLKAGQNTLRFLPPLTITQDEIDLGFKRLEKALDTI